ncbi:MAG: hypothetical protein AAGU14_09555 [Eubacteriaceae bacterium]
MTKKEMIKLLSESINPNKICGVFLKYDYYYSYYFPLKVNNKFFLGIKEDDFILNGYSIRRIRDIAKVEIKNDKCLEINILEGNINNLYVPEINITNWKAIFTSLKNLGKNIIIEDESLVEDEGQFFIGSIESVHSNFVYFKHFDADGIWKE